MASEYATDYDRTSTGLTVICGGASVTIFISSEACTHLCLLNKASGYKLPPRANCRGWQNKAKWQCVFGFT